LNGKLTVGELSLFFALYSRQQNRLRSYNGRRNALGENPPLNGRNVSYFFGIITVGNNFSGTLEGRFSPLGLSFVASTSDGG